MSFAKPYVRTSTSISPPLRLLLCRSRDNEYLHTIVTLLLAYSRITSSQQNVCYTLFSFNHCSFCLVYNLNTDFSIVNVCNLFQYALSNVFYELIHSLHFRLINVIIVPLAEFTLRLTVFLSYFVQPII